MATRKRKVNFDAECSAAIVNPNLLVPWWLMASYLYYIEDVSLLSDELFDQMCKRLIAEWDRIEHGHKKIVPFDALHAGTGYTLRRNDYPQRTRSAALALIAA